MKAMSLQVGPAQAFAPIESLARTLPPSLFATEEDRLPHGTNGGKTGAGDSLPMGISDAFVADILRPYRPNARYLKSAEITHFCETAAQDPTSDESLIIGAGGFSIPESCYIDDTGHFNAVEFNICFNQLAYVVFGKSVEAGLMQRLRPRNAKIPSFAEYKRHQLPAMLIARIDGVRFLKPMKSDDFRGELSINKMALVGEAGFFFTSVIFSDCEGAKAKGAVVLAFQPKLTS